MSDKVLVGKIVGTSGLKGYIRVYSFCKSSSELGDFKILYDIAGNKYKISKIISTKGSVVVVAMKYFNSVSDGKKLISTELYVKREDMPELEDGDYYYSDLMGMAVYINAEHYGTVVDVVNYGASDIIEVLELSTNNLQMYPFIDDFIEKVDLEKRQIFLKAIEKL